MITIKLPRSVTGQGILDGFKDASTFQISPTCRWEPRPYVVASGAAYKDLGFVPARGYDATPLYLRKPGRIERFFTGRQEGVWEGADGGYGEAPFKTYIRLAPVIAPEKYEEVSLSVYHAYSEDEGGFSVTVNPDSRPFSLIRPAYDRIVNGFIKEIC